MAVQKVKGYVQRVMRLHIKFNIGKDWLPLQLFKKDELFIRKESRTSIFMEKLESISQCILDRMFVSIPNVC